MKIRNLFKVTLKNVDTQNMKAALITCALALTFQSGIHAFAGPSDGGGTNLSISEDELTDFVKFKKEYGDKVQMMNVKKFKLNGSNQTILEQVKPAIDHVGTEFPGLEEQLMKVFNKPWMVSNINFEARNEKEKLVILQTNEVVIVNSDWLKTASEEQVLKAFLHEAVRSFANEILLAHFAVGPGKIATKFADQITESLTPLIYAGADSKLIYSTSKKNFNNICSELNRTTGCPYQGSEIFTLTRREDILPFLEGVKSDKLINDICANINSGFLPENAEGIVAKNLNSIKENWSLYFSEEEYDCSKCSYRVFLGMDSSFSKKYANLRRALESISGAAKVILQQNGKTPDWPAINVREIADNCRHKKGMIEEIFKFQSQPRRSDHNIKSNAFEEADLNTDAGKLEPIEIETAF